MKIKICDKNQNRITESLEKENGRATSLTICSYQAISELARVSEKKLSDLPKKYRQGAALVFVPTGPSRSYGYKAKTTRVELARGSSDWFLVNIEKIDIFPGSAGVDSIALSTDQFERMVDVKMDGFCAITKAKGEDASIERAQLKTAISKAKGNFEL